MRETESWIAAERTGFEACECLSALDARRRQGPCRDGNEQRTGRAYGALEQDRRQRRLTPGYNRISMLD
ncbi:hypothetical protein BRPE64_ECDS01350 (plasmid) [Caballeronia insecticola]|uniref:Uncharacterized protein n=1 Tax=Caballeronia insecticola TaxID=758793 RepID=A0A060PGV6_9BURK|nr:hypothetical protein BRPE64_ECDS01350 [Caballeronia insecticola]